MIAGKRSSPGNPGETPTFTKGCGNGQTQESSDFRARTCNIGRKRTKGAVRVSNYGVKAWNRCYVMYFSVSVKASPVQHLTVLLGELIN